MCRLYSFILLFLCVLYPLSTFAEMPDPNLMNNSDNTIRRPSVGRQTDNEANKQDHEDDSKSDRVVHVGRSQTDNNVNRPQNNGNNHEYNKHDNKGYSNNYNDQHSSNYHEHHSSSNVVYRPVTVQRVNRIRPYSQNIRPHSHTTIVYTNTPTYTVIDDTDDSSYHYASVNSSTVYESDHRLGFGLNVVVSFTSGFGSVDWDVAGGLGFYITFRPVRYISLEFANNYLFGSLEYDDHYNQGYTKVPVSLGLRYHFFDYGNIDLYLATAAEVVVWSFVDNYDKIHNRYVYLKDRGFQFGAQFGAGIIYNIDAFAFGIDLRYTLESSPDYVPYLNMDQNSDIQHGCLLTFIIGLSL